MGKVLVPVNSNAAQMKSALAEAGSLYREEAAEIHLLNVQATVPRFVAGFFSSSNLRQIQQEAGMEELASAQAMLKAAHIPHHAHVKVGRSAETIVRTAREIGCDRIVFGQPERAGVAQKLFGTLAGQVRHLLGVAGDCRVIGS